VPIIVWFSVNTKPPGDSLGGFFNGRRERTVASTQALQRALGHLFETQSIDATVRY
jgi:hypothetical protein